MKSLRGLAKEEVERFYDRFGAKQDKQNYYEDTALTDLLKHARFDVAHTVVEFGCGYGTFSIPVAEHIQGGVVTFDIDPQMVEFTRRRALDLNLHNLVVEERDFVASGTGLPDQSADFVMLFNILHAEAPDNLLAEAWRTLTTNGLLGIMHWNYDRLTPRGPSMEIRPRPEQCRDWALAAGFETLPPGIVSLPPYHYGLVVRKPAADAAFSY